MARADIQYARELAFPVSKGRLSSESVPRPRPKKGSRTASYASGMDGQWAGDAGLVPSLLDVEASREPSPFPEYSDYSHSHDSKERGSIRLTRPPAMTSNEPTWHQDSTHLMSASGLNGSSEGLDYRSQRSKPIKPKVHIKPMLRKMSRDDAPSTSIDLSRSSTEQEGLGIYMNFERDRRRSESLTGVTYRRTPSGLHHRSTSGTSQFSTATGSSGGKPSASQYVYPMRPTPKTYTPPHSQSYQTSVNESDGQDDSSPETESHFLPGSETHRTNRASSGPMPRLSLQIEDESLTRLSGISQTNVASRPSLSYSRDNGSTLDTASPTSRTSLDFVFRSRTRTSTDPVSRAATIQAARQAFEEKEAAKARRFEKQQSKAEERQTRRRVKRTMSGGPESPAVHSRAELSEKSGSSSMSARDSKPTMEKPERQPSTSFKSQSKSTWVLFMTWLRTRVFKFRRKIRKAK
ncbi:hypothetical protein N7532_002434 [Penicillium argentinense]|uniref:Uncharacterized protein n=1 Tax=Penicillium argentinense TaxID=1131581 RepID=A0A9W9G0E2_9EURO|nr:uncharacterized protein N7532_002434 [Penicillium argentinense]KAJ5109789.1 hypothetical protein N7532_002434 [Penicillium argentinense]